MNINELDSESFGYLFFAYLGEQGIFESSNLKGVNPNFDPKNKNFVKHKDIYDSLRFYFEKNCLEEAYDLMAYAEYALDKYHSINSCSYFKKQMDYDRGFREIERGNKK